MLTGLIKRRQGHLDECIELMQQAGVLDPRNNDIWMNLARTYRAQGRFKEAHAIFDRAIVIAPDEPEIIGEKAENFLAAGELEAAGDFLGRYPVALTGKVFEPVLLTLLRRDFPNALSRLEQKVEGEPARIKLAARLEGARIKQITGNGAEARPIFQAIRAEVEQLQTAGDRHQHLRAQLIESAAWLGDAATVERELPGYLEEAEKDKWTEPLAEETAAIAFVALGQLERALPHLEKALKPSAQGLTPAYLRLDYRWDSVRHHPRFQELASGK